MLQSLTSLVCQASHEAEIAGLVPRIALATLALFGRPQRCASASCCWNMLVDLQEALASKVWESGSYIVQQPWGLFTFANLCSVKPVGSWALPRDHALTQHDKGYWHPHKHAEYTIVCLCMAPQ